MDGVTFLVLVCPVLLDRGGGFYVAGVSFFSPYHALFSLIKERSLSGWSDLLSPRMLCSP